MPFGKANKMENNFSRDEFGEYNSKLEE